ncbi:UDP-N-acetylmuramate dehydrogenase [Mariniphaga anaerophila]|uniref:UDP-N-acetylenolpyruvoylglucosamine reductase n=1 Tax=Mariniphaga anaerophila TaxID=1484053 RepID=A0A1M5EVL9_9BACT|nr:UDP-N-acetylmuramate dehydrogenase [Mariniphaga anaerophila]SHF83258.1 UDP-N-acetylmuramate dehydrogenase [Mariniphaga anaerophila]
MIRFSENYSLKQHNTFGVQAAARYFFEFTEQEDLETFVSSNETWKELPLLILGGGSNMLFRGDFEGLVLHANIPGIVKVKEDRQNVWFEVGAGEVWDDFVEHCVNYGVGGVENLSLIPGVVGASPVQNIGAYGQEVGNVIALVKGYDLAEKRPVQFCDADCKFGYRDSLFKQQWRNRLVITSVVFKLEKFPEFNLKYGQVEEKVHELGEVNLQNIRQAVIAIRSSKLPDVSELGNAGSFFKNPLVNVATADKIRVDFPDAPVYPVTEKQVKLAAGWLIEKAGWKGRREGNVGVHEKQALVLVNYGNATGKEIYDFSERVKQAVLEKFGISLEREVNCI